jgi:protein dithiol oxidoreductase (disulfide-forming)
MRKLLLLAAMSALLTACGAKNSDSSTPEAAAPDAPAPAPATASDTKELDTATQESAGSEASAGEGALKSLIAMPENVQLPGGRWKAGTHYKPVVPAQSTSADAGQVEVLEFMWLGCNHCADLEPTIVAWAKQKPAYVKFVQEHVLWHAAAESHARLLYTLQTLNREDLVPKAFDEIHQRKNMLVSLKNDAAETLSIQLAFAKANGVSEADFKREYNGFTVSSRLKRSAEINRRYRIETVPVIIINGKYETGLDMAGGKKELMQLITDLAAVEKGR